jgi:hypothetical protein
MAPNKTHLRPLSGFGSGVLVGSPDKEMTQTKPATARTARPSLLVSVFDRP